MKVQQLISDPNFAVHMHIGSVQISRNLFQIIGIPINIGLIAKMIFLLTFCVIFCYYFACSQK